MNGAATMDAPRLQPHSLEAERAVLGAILLDPAALARVRNLIEPQDFYLGHNQILYRAMLTLADNGQPLDNITLTDYLREQGTLAQVGGSAALAELICEVASPVNIIPHARIVREHAQRRALIRHAAQARDLAYEGRPLAQVEQCLRAAIPAEPAAPHPAAAGEPRSGFAPRTLAQLFDEPEPVEPAWLLEDILPRGALAALVAKPKVGKSTIAYELACKVAQGRPFLGRATTQGQVLVVAVEEHRREVKRRLRDFGAEQLDAVHVHIGPLSDSPETRHALARYITQHEIALVVVDTLNTFWRVPDENDAAAVTQAIKPLLELARQTDACVLLIHHARKSEGEFGDEIRGSGALFSLLDVALILKRHEVETQRKLSIVSRFSEAPPELILELREHGYESLGDPASVGKRAKETKLLDVLSANPTDAKTLAGQAGIPVKAVYTILDALTQQGKAARTGTGRKGDPFLFAKIRFRFPPKDGTPEETNCNVPTVSGGTTLQSPGGQFVSSDPPTIGKETETNSGPLADNSFLPTPVPPGRNESAELMEDIEI